MPERLDRGERTAPEMAAREEVLARGRGLYDGVRPLFDVTNNLGLVVKYMDGETSRPHRSDRLIRAEFEALDTDTFTPYPNYPLTLSSFLGTSELAVSFRLFPSEKVSNHPDGINVRIETRDGSRHIGGIITPNGLVASNGSPETHEAMLLNEAQVHSAFQLVATLISEGRLHPPTSNMSR